MKLSHLFVILSLSHATSSYAEIYKRVDADGHVTYSSEPSKGGTKLYLKSVPTMQGTRESRRSTPEDFPKVDFQTQKRRDNTRRVILQDELASEEALLDKARQNLKTTENKPETSVGPDGNPYRSTAQYTEKLKSAQNEVALHEQNIKALQTEVSHLK